MRAEAIAMVGGRMKAQRRRFFHYLIEAERRQERKTLVGSSRLGKKIDKKEERERIKFILF